MIEIKNLYLNYIKEYSALYNLNLTVKDNEKVALLGNTDSGKTSLIRCICGLEKYNKGEIYINQTNIKKINFKKDVNLMYLSSSPVFFNNKTVYYNLTYSLKLRGFSENTINQKINKALDDLGIDDLKNKKIKQLSAKEKQIINIARSIIREADIYLIDDIFIFDNITNEKIAKILLQSFKENATVIFAINSSKTYLINSLNITKTYTLNSGSLETL